MKLLVDMDGVMANYEQAIVDDKPKITGIQKPT